MRQRGWVLVALIAGLILGQSGKVPAQEKPKKINPFTGNSEAIAEGKRLFSLYGCPGCHGREGGGGMGKPLLDDQWEFGSDDETLFKLIRGEIPGQTMPDVFGKAMKDEEIWKVLAFIRTLYKGDPSRINW